MATKASNAALAAATKIDGSGNVEADTLDGIDSLQFTRSDQADNSSEDIIFAKGIGGTYVRIGTGGQWTTGGSQTIHVPSTLGDGNLYLQYGNGASTSLARFGGGGTAVSILDSQNDSYRISSGSTNSYLNADGGNVGIGTISPLADLHINNANPELRVNTTNAANKTKLKITYNDSVGGEFAYFPSTAELFIDNLYPRNAGTVYGDLVFRINDAGTQTQKMRISADTGYVSVGSHTAAADLHIKSTTNKTIGGESATFSNSFFTIESANGDALHFDPNEIQSNGTLNVFSEGAFRIGTNNIERFRIESTGGAEFHYGVGVLSKTPEAGTVGLALPPNSDGASTLYSIHLDGLYSNGVSIGVRSANSRDQLHFGQSWNPGSGTKFKVDITNGRVTVGNGIETHDPNVTLEVVGTDAIRIPAGSTAQRPSLLSTQKGYIRFNNDAGVNSFEYWDGTSWRMDVPIGTISNPASSLTALAQEQSVNGSYYFNIGGQTFQAYVDFSGPDGDAWMHVGTISDNNEARSSASHMWSNFNASQATPFDDGSTFGTQSFTADFKSAAWNLVPFTKWAIRDQGASLRNLFYTNTISSNNSSFDTYWGSLSWLANGSELSNSAYSNGRVASVSVTNFGISDPCLLGNKSIVLLKFGERDGVQDNNRDRSMITSHSYDQGDNVDSPAGLGTFASGSTLGGIYYRDITPDANQADAPPNSISGAPLNYTLWIK